MSELGYWTKTSKLDEGFLGTALAAAMSNKKQKKLVFVGILTVTDNSSSGLASDAVGQKIQTAIDQMKIFQVIVKVRKIVSCNASEVTNTLKNWADNLGLDIVLTIGGTGIETSSITPDATRKIIDKELPAMTLAMIMSGLKVDPLAMLFRGVCGVRNSALIINLPNNTQRAGDCLSIVLPHLPYAIDCLKGGRSIEESPGSLSTPSNAQSQTPTVTSLQYTSSQAHHVSPPGAHHVVPSLHVTTAHHVAPSHHSVPSHHVTRPHHLQPSASPSMADSGIGSSHHLPSHHHSERLQNDVIVTSEHRRTISDEAEQLTEDDILGGDSFESLIAKESLKVVGDLPSQIDNETGNDGFANSKIQDFSKIARRPRHSLFPEVTVDKAFATVFAVTNPFPAAEKSYKDTLDHVLASDVVAETPVPAVETAILDGYAVIAADTPGDVEVVELKKNELLTLGRAVRVTTGAPMPPGADAVVAVEETLLVSEADDGCTEISVRCLNRASPGQFVRAKGSDIRCNEVVIKTGTTIGHLEVALLASLGISTVRVHKHPVVAVISYGEKLREPDDRDVSFDEIRDTNRLTLLMSLQKKGYPVVDMGIVNGGPKALKETLVRAYEKADVIITTGGAAVGENDVVKPILVEMGALLHFGRVTMKPGAPTGFATLDTPKGKKIFFTLAGVPVPAYIGYYLFVLPCLRRLHGSKDPRSAVIKVKISSDIYLDTVPEFQRVTLRNDGGNPIPWADVTGRQVISRMLSLVAADALLLLPAKSDEKLTMKRGEVLEAMLIA